MATEYGTTWWGNCWLDALKGIDNANRIPRGKSYANTGKVRDFKFDYDNHTIKARVLGHYDPFYKVVISLPEIDKKKMDRLLEAIASDSLILSRLADRELDPSVSKLAEKFGIDLFPRRWSDLGMRCSCPDSAVPCKHIAAVIYKVSEEIDANPFILFTLRGIDLVAELQKRGIEINQATEVHMPSWNEIIQQTSFTASPVPSDVPADQWLKKLSELTFTEIEDKPEGVFALLSEKPAGYVYGNLRALSVKVLNDASKLARKQLRDKSERSIPTWNEIYPLLSINTWGQPCFEAKLSWTKQSETGEQLNCSVQDFIARDLEKSPAYDMFSGGVTQAHFAQSSEALEALYDIWMIATKLVEKHAVMPQMYEPIDDYFAIRWIPSTTSTEIEKLTTSVGELFRNVPAEFFQIAKAPRNISAKTLGEVILGVFIQSYITQAWRQSSTHTQQDRLELEVLFSFLPLDCEDAPNAKAIGMYLEGWLSPLTLTNYEVQPVLVVRDFLLERSQAPDSVEVVDDEGESIKIETPQADSEVGIEMGIVPANIAELQLLNSIIPLHEVLDNDDYRSLRFQSLRSMSQLTRYCPQLAQLIKNPYEVLHLPIQTLTELLLESIPKLRMLGVQIVLPKSLESLLKPTLSMSLDIIEQLRDGVGFIGLTDLLSFDWEVAIGDRGISREEFERLSLAAGRLVRFKNQFIYIDKKDVVALSRHLKEKASAVNKVQLLTAALSGDYKHFPVHLSKNLEQTLAKLFEEKPIETSQTLNAKLRPYQSRGFVWMMRNIKIAMGSIIADDMGLGKTLQVIAVLDKLREEKQFVNKKALVVVPTSLVMNWQREIAKFAPDLTVSPFYGLGRSLQTLTGDIVLTTYGTLRSSIAELKKLKWRLLVIDEAQAIKNYSTATAKSVSSIDCEAQIAMSGTPVENRLMEYWSIMNFANPGLLGSARNFMQEFCDPIEKRHDKQAADRFRRITAPFILRRMKSDKSIIRDLPEKISTDQYCELTASQIALYKEVVEHCMMQLASVGDEFQKKALVLRMMTSLKQVCDAPALYQKNDATFGTPECSGKAQRLFEILEMAQAAQRKVLIFTQFKSMGALLQKWIQQKFNFEPAFIEGSMSVSMRQEVVDQFQTRRDKPFMILSLKAAGTGLNLTAASIVVHFDLWWNPAVEDQATDRAYRIGQKNQVQVYRFITAGTFEEKINQMIQSKKELVNLAVATGESWLGDLSTKDLREIFSMAETQEQEQKNQSAPKQRRTKRQGSQITMASIADGVCEG